MEEVGGCRQCRWQLACKPSGIGALFASGSEADGRSGAGDCGEERGGEYGDDAKDTRPVANQNVCRPDEASGKTTSKSSSASSSRSWWLRPASNQMR